MQGSQHMMASWKKKSSKNLISGWNVNITMVKINLELLQEIESAKMQLEIPYLLDNIGNQYVCPGLHLQIKSGRIVTGQS